MKLIELKIKRLELAHEVKLNRHGQRLALVRARSARKTNYDFGPHMDQYHSLRNHQMLIVSPAARAASLAASYLRGQPYGVVETKPKPKSGRVQSKPDMVAIVRNVNTFSGAELAKYPPCRLRDVEDWMDGEMTHYHLIEAAEREAAMAELEQSSGIAEGYDMTSDEK